MDNRYYAFDDKGNIETIEYKRTNLSPGIYDSQKKMLATWDELVSDYGLDIEKNQTDLLETQQEGSGALYSIIYNLEDDKFADIETLILPKTVTNIGAAAIQGIKSLKYIEVEEGNPVYEDRNSNAIIEKSTNTLILGCENTIIPSDITSIGAAAFAYSKLGNIIIPKAVNNIQAFAFYRCFELKNLIFQNGNNLNYIGPDAFQDASLTSIVIPKNVERIEHGTFDSAVKLTNIFFENGSKLKYIDEYAFEECRELTNITIPNSVESIGSVAFSNCKSLTSIIIPSSVTRIEREAFSSCTNLTSVTFENTMGWSIEDSSDVTSRVFINVTNANTNANNLVYDYVLYYWNRTNS